ncbi:hypothetical protein [uncultured Arcobacter sp.]|uniref:hypothetical protein n=1 Tax=uncultured Arcobacter sp. TaxID=165434 RepID=UPI00263910BC|nr:hypothetical protein [uncultured Arcobacter sp.]
MIFDEKLSEYIEKQVEIGIQEHKKKLKADIDELKGVFCVSSEYNYAMERLFDKLYEVING